MIYQSKLLGLYHEHMSTASYSTKRISKKLLQEISQALKSIDAYGSVELYIQDSTVTQITTRNIQKTNTKSKNKG